jgi:hypothetical protein
MVFTAAGAVTPPPLQVPVLTWANPADIVYGTSLSTNQLNATASTQGTYAYDPAAGTVLNAGSNQTLRVSFTPTDTATYTNASSTVQLNVLKAVPQITWAAPAPITVGTPLSTNQLNATASAPGSFVYTPAAGTVLAAGTGQKLGAVFTPTDSANFGVATASVMIDVLPSAPAPELDATTLRWDTNGFSFQFSGVDGQQYTVESSEDLVTWTRLGSVTATGGKGTFVDSAAVSKPARFYRVTHP